MRMGVLAATVAALWIQPASAEILITGQGGGTLSPLGLSQCIRQLIQHHSGAGWTKCRADRNLPSGRGSGAVRVGLLIIRLRRDRCGPSPISQSVSHWYLRSSAALQRPGCLASAKRKQGRPDMLHVELEDAVTLSHGPAT